MHKPVILKSAICWIATWGFLFERILSNSLVILSYVSFVLKASRILGSRDASIKSSVIVNPNRLANLIARITLSGSSKNVLRGGSGVLTIPYLRSSIPLPVKSSI